MLYRRYSSVQVLVAPSGLSTTGRTVALALAVAVALAVEEVYTHMAIHKHELAAASSVSLQFDDPLNNH